MCYWLPANNCYISKGHQLPRTATTTWHGLQLPPQVQLAKPLITLLSKEWHRHQAIQRPNIIQVGVRWLPSTQSVYGEHIGGKKAPSHS
jgi:hypothetical protein